MKIDCCPIIHKSRLNTKQQMDYTICENTRINQMGKEKLFLEKLAEAYQTFDASVIEDCLADDMHYASMWVFHEMTSKAEYLDYLKGKLNTFKNKDIYFEFEIVKGRMHEHALLVTNQQGPNGEQLGFVADLNENGQVIMLNMTASFLF